MPHYVTKASQKNTIQIQNFSSTYPVNWPSLRIVKIFSMPALPPLYPSWIQTRREQSINGTFLYYTRDVEPTMIPTINEISSLQTQPTSDSINKYNMLMYYAHTYPAPSSTAMQVICACTLFLTPPTSSNQRQEAEEQVIFTSAILHHHWLQYLHPKETVLF